MRKDMDRLMVLPPRWGHGDPQSGLRRRRRERHPLEEAPRRESMRRGATKSSSEYFAPLVRFLRSRVGRPWNEVYSEIRSVIAPDSVVKEHVYVHLDEYVVRHVFERDGELWVGERGGEPLRGWRWRDSFYVCPRTGLLWEVPRKRHPSRHGKRRNVRIGGPALQYHECDGLWFEVHLAEVPADAELLPACWDPLFQRALAELSPFDLHERYGSASLYAARKRQVSRKEIGKIQKLPAARWGARSRR